MQKSMRRSFYVTLLLVTASVAKIHPHPRPSTVANNRCGENCSMLTKAPVCGSDGKTYTNECIMKYENCEAGNQGVRKAHDGACATGKNCGEPCPYNPSEVCGSDGKTYLNECIMKFETCMAGKSGVYKVSNKKCDYK